MQNKRTFLSFYGAIVAVIVW